MRRIHVYPDGALQCIELGRQGENLAREVVFHIAGWTELYGPGTVALLCSRKGDESPYPCVVTQTEEEAYWPVTRVETAVSGSGAAELQFRQGERVVKSRRFAVRVAPSMGEGLSETPSAPEADWVDQVLSAAARVEAATVHPPRINEGGNWEIWDQESGGYLDTGTAAYGSHQALTDREQADQHPIQAVTGLREELDALAEEVSGQEVLQIWDEC